MRTESKFKYALKEMMATTPLEDINVTTLCKKCGCHRQTFYYHFQNIYDLLAAYFLNEKVTGMSDADSLEKSFYCLIGYASDNFDFLKSTYNSAAHDLVEDFFYNKLVTKLFSLLNGSNSYGLTAPGYRSVARRYSRLVADEFGVQFRNQSTSKQRFEKAMKRFVKITSTTVLPAFVELAKQEKER